MRQLECEAIIFDLDGVLIDSSAVIERSWRLWAGERDLDEAEVLRLTPGRRMIEVVRRLAPHLDAEAEARRLAAREAADTDGLREVEGAVGLIRSLPPGVWAVATSGSRTTALARLRFAGLPVPKVLITADDVTHGKPDPQAYLLAAERLGLSPAGCVVVEDAPAGIQAARAAGMRVIAVATTHAPQVLAGADALVDCLLDIHVIVDGRLPGRTVGLSGVLVQVRAG
jgi:sugar-phosphatase